jgi:hypothetical protein
VRVLEFEQQGGYPGLVVMEELPLTKRSTCYKWLRAKLLLALLQYNNSVLRAKVFCDKEREGDERRCSEFVALSSSF